MQRRKLVMKLIKCTLFISGPEVFSSHLLITGLAESYVFRNSSPRHSGMVFARINSIICRAVFNNLA
jgi:hypothetical protein